MIYFAIVSRSTDGLALAANSDSPPMSQHQGLEDAYKHMKLLARMSARFPDRCTLPINSYCVHFITALDLSLFVLCDATYPVVLAFSFLSDMQKDFLQFYDRKKAMSAQRPYALIDFDLPLQKLKHKYNNPRSLSTKLNLQDLSQELRLRPPYVMCADELRPGYGQGRDQYSSYKSTTAAVYNRYIPFSLAVLVSIALNCFCAFLNLTRGISVINDAHIETTFDSEHYQYGATFIVCCLLSLYQVYMMCYPLRRRKSLACATLGSICLCQVYLWEYRNNVGILFHITVACLGTFMILTRRIQEKLPQYTL